MRRTSRPLAYLPPLLNPSFVQLLVVMLGVMHTVFWADAPLCPTGLASRGFLAHPPAAPLPLAPLPLTLPPLPSAPCPPAPCPACAQAARAAGRSGCPLWALAGVSGLAAVALAALATQLLVNRKLAVQLRQRDRVRGWVGGAAGARVCVCVWGGVSVCNSLGARLTFAVIARSCFTPPRLP